MSDKRTIIFEFEFEFEYGGVDSGVVDIGDTGYSGVDLGRQILLTSNNY